MKRRGFIVSFFGVITGFVVPGLILPKKSGLIVPPVKPKVLLPNTGGFFQYAQYGNVHQYNPGDLTENIKTELNKVVESRAKHSDYNWVIYTANGAMVQDFYNMAKEKYHNEYITKTNQ